MSVRTELTVEQRNDDALLREALTDTDTRSRGWINRCVIWLWEATDDAEAARADCERYAERLGWRVTGYYSDPVDADVPASSHGALDQLRAALSDVIVTTTTSFERMTAQQQADLLSQAELTQCSVSVLDRA